MVVNYKGILSYNLEQEGIHRPEKLYEFMENLGKSPDIGCPTLDLTSGRPVIVAEYTGNRKIGDAREGMGRKPSSVRVLRNLRSISNSLPTVDGIVSYRLHPSLRNDGECYGRLTADGVEMQIIIRKAGKGT